MSSNILSSHAEQDLNQIWFDVFQASKSEALADKYIDGFLSTKSGSLTRGNPGIIWSKDSVNGDSKNIWSTTP